MLRKSKYISQDVKDMESTTVPALKQIQMDLIDMGVFSTRIDNIKLYLKGYPNANFRFRPNLDKIPNFSLVYQFTGEIPGYSFLSSLVGVSYLEELVYQFIKRYQLSVNDLESIVIDEVGHNDFRLILNSGTKALYIGEADLNDSNTSAYQLVDYLTTIYKVDDCTRLCLTVDLGNIDRLIISSDNNGKWSNRCLRLFNGEF